jgi:hypothetical protein
MYTLYVLVRNLDADRGELQFRDFRLSEISHGNRAAVDEVNQLLRTEDVRYGDWLLVREYEDVPTSAGENPAGVGRIPLDAEETLLLLRLFRPGDLSFARLGIRKPDGNCLIQSSYRVITDLVDNSVFPYSLHQAECASWDMFADELAQTPAWTARWFATAKRFFLYGGAKEFNPHWNEVDRLVDYMIALEAVLVPERDFVGNRLRNRAARLIRQTDEERATVVRQVRDLYEFRSSIVHGATLSDNGRNTLSEEWPRFESLVREVLVTALRSLPLDDNGRTAILKRIYDITDEQRADKVRQEFRSIHDEQLRASLARELFA